MSALPGAWVVAAVAAAWKTSLLLLVMAAASILLRRRSAALRHTLWTVALAGVLVVTLVTLSGVRWPVTVAGWPALPGQGSGLAARGATASGGASGATGSRVGFLSGGAPAAAAAGNASTAGRPVPSSAATGDVVGAGPSPLRGTSAGASSGKGATWHWPRPDWPTLLFLLWLAGVSTALLVLTVGWLRVRVLERGAHPLREGEAVRRLVALERELGVTAGVRLLEGDEAVMPMTWGLRRPAILLPGQWSRWHPALLDAVLLHELAHVRRRDVPAQLVGDLACALNWFNPLVWWAAGRQREESELACDDVGARGLASRQEYAYELVELARSLRSQRPLAVVAIALARRAQLTGRVVALLDERRCHTTASGRQRRATVALASVLVLPLAVASPRAPDASAPARVIEVLPPPAKGPAVVTSGVGAAPAAPAPAGAAPTTPAPVATRATSALAVAPALAARPAPEVPPDLADPGAALTALTPAVSERPQSFSSDAVDVRARPGPLPVVAGPGLAAAAAQRLEPRHYAIFGTVTDSLTGKPIADAAVGFKPAYRAVMTDSLGRFLLRGAKSGKQTVVVQQLGYEDRTLTFQAVDSVARLDVLMNPDPIVLKGLTVVVRDYRRMLKRLSVGRVYERRDLMAMSLATLGSVLRQTGAIQPVDPGSDYGPSGPRCANGKVWVHGQRQCLTLTFDGQPVYAGGLSAIPSYPASEIYAVIVGPGGSSVTVLTNWYIEYLARTGQRLAQ